MACDQSGCRRKNRRKGEEQATNDWTKSARDGPGYGCNETSEYESNAVFVPLRPLKRRQIGSDHHISR